MTHCSSVKSDPSDDEMSGRATFTIVMSMSSMNIDVQTTASVHHLRSTVVLYPPGSA
jgi:hypothetical protein